MILQTSLRVSSVLSAAADLAAGGRQGAEAEPGPAPGRGRGQEAQHHHVPVREHSYHLPCTTPVNGGEFSQAGSARKH